MSRLNLGSRLTCRLLGWYLRAPCPSPRGMPVTNPESTYSEPVRQTGTYSLSLSVPFRFYCYTIIAHPYSINPNVKGTVHLISSLIMEEFGQTFERFDRLVHVSTASKPREAAWKDILRGISWKCILVNTLWSSLSQLTAAYNPSCWQTDDFSGCRLLPQPNR
jgi:hypothetical protein